MESMKKPLADKRYRHAFLNAFVRQGVALQVQLLRKREGWSQKKLGQTANKKQNAIARIEDPSYGKFTITTLLELANAFDVALSVRFIPFSELEKQGEGDLTAGTLTVASYAKENPEFRADDASALPIRQAASSSARITIEPATGLKMSIKRGSSTIDYRTFNGTGL
jgi:transcriptional regulator with XRE-family HTH domain